MTSNLINLGICAAGSGVSQSIVQSVQLSHLPIRTVGIGCDPMALAPYHCDHKVIVKPFADPEYLPSLIQLCQDYRIDVIIPGHDDQAHLFAKHIDEIQRQGTQVLVSGAELLDLCRDKTLLDRNLGSVADVFVRCYRRDEFLQLWSKGAIELPVIAKPKNGFASKGIVIIGHESDFDKIEEGHVVQELAVPSRRDPEQGAFLQQIRQGVNSQLAEVSIQLVTDRNGGLIGKMATRNRLRHGAPVEVLPIDSPAIWSAVESLLPTFKAKGLRGPLNLQGRITDSGLRIFEMNARFTGITGLRAAMGFNEVEACLKHWCLGINDIRISGNPHRLGLRQLANYTVDLRDNQMAANRWNVANNKTVSKVKTVLVTGSTGSIGRRLTKLLSQDAGFEVMTLDRNKAKAEQLWRPFGVSCADWNAYTSGELSLGSVDCLIHLASARPHHGAESIASSMHWSFELFSRAVDHGVHEIINLSSQSIYDENSPPFWLEDSPVGPQTPYATAKYAIELFLQNLSRVNPTLNAASVRLESVTGADRTIEKVEAIARMVATCRREQVVRIVCPEHRFSRIDIRDAVDGIRRMLDVDSRSWKTVYNLGVGRWTSLIEIAKMIVARNGGGRIVHLNRANETPGQIRGVDSTRFRRDFDWKPKYSIKETIDSMFEYSQHKVVPFPTTSFGSYLIPASEAFNDF